MFYFGVDYYPEHWPEERWPEDVRLMAEAGFNVARLAEFAWSKLEPVEGRFDFDWLDRAVGMLQSREIKIVLGTPTASPPPWLMIQHPELFRVRDDGQRMTFGHRREYCPNHPIYHEHTRRIVTRMAEHYANHPAVVGWQIDNEFGDRCYCPTCAGAFQGWLQRRYEALAHLNERWGTVFWSHAYNDWSEIPVPLTTGGSPNPGLALDFYRFASDSYVAYQQLQIDLLRERCPNHFITHNFMGFRYDRLNYFDLARALDFVAWDIYPRKQWALRAESDPAQAALGHDTMRGLKRQNFWVMEQQAGPGGWEMISVVPRPGELRLWAYQAIAHGADAVVFFRWRTARFGAEQYWHGLLDHDGHPGRRYAEIKRMGAEIKKVGDRIAGSAVPAQVAFMLSYDSRFAFQIQPNNPRFGYPEHFLQVYRGFHRHHLPIDVTAPTDDLSAYRVVAAPALHVVTPAIAENLTRFVQAGGVLIVTQRTGVKDDGNAVVNQRLPGLLAVLCGVEVEEYDSLAADTSNELEFVAPEMAKAPRQTVSVLCDVLLPVGATVIARYTQDHYAGKPAITLNRFGQGHVVYVGAVGDEQLYQGLAGWLLDLAGVRRLPDAPSGVEVAERVQNGRGLIFVLNHTDHVQEMTLDGAYTNLLDEPAWLQGRAAIKPYDVLVLGR